MPIVQSRGVLSHARQHGYTVGGFAVDDLSTLTTLFAAAEETQSPLLLMLSPSNPHVELLAAAVERGAEQATVPVAVIATEVNRLDEAVAAVRFGCSGLVVAGDEGLLNEVEEMAQGCGVSVERTLDQRFDTSTDITSQLEQSGAAGQAAAVLDAVERWSPVEHLIIFNANLETEAAYAMMAEGRRVLSAIPGVRSVFTGEAIQEQAGYQFTWLVRFCHPAVIDSYRDHPDHVAFADNHFRPVAGDRISIDYRVV